MNMDKIKKYSEFYGESLIIYYHFPKKLAEKSYSTFNLRFSMVWAAAVPIKTNRSRLLYMPANRKNGNIKCYSA